MSINVICVGKIAKNSPECLLVNEYKKRLGKTLTITEIDSKDYKEQNLIKIKEKELILSKLNSKNFVIALDQRGENLTSNEFAKIINQEKLPCFIIGGAFGLDQEILTRANRIIAFGSLTWPHKIVRVMLFEQIYRAFTIISGHPYHK